MDGRIKRGGLTTEQRLALEQVNKLLPWCIRRLAEFACSETPAVALRALELLLDRGLGKGTLEIAIEHVGQQADDRLDALSDAQLGTLLDTIEQARLLSSAQTTQETLDALPRA